MPTKEIPVLPFLVRDMLDFEHASTIAIRVTHQATEIGPLTIRGITREGVFTFTTTTQNNVLPISEDFRITDIPVFVSVLGTGTEFVQGQVFVSLSLIINGDRILELCSGLVTVVSGISYPAQATSDQIPGRGNFRVVEGSDPAAGAECTITCPTGVLWHVKSFMVIFTTSATVASRRPHLVFTLGGLAQISAFSSVDQLLSLSRQYSFAKYGSIADEIDDDDILVSLPEDIWMIPGDTVVTQTVGIQATDNYGSPRIAIEEWVRSTA